MVAITGNTYAVKDQLKALGGKFTGGRWLVPEGRADEAWALVGGRPESVLAYEAAKAGADAVFRYRTGGPGDLGPTTLLIRVVEEGPGEWAFEAHRWDNRRGVAEPAEWNIGGLFASREAALAGIDAAFARRAKECGYKETRRIK